MGHLVGSLNIFAEFGFDSSWRTRMLTHAHKTLLSDVNCSGETTDKHPARAFQRREVTISLTQKRL